MTTRSTCPATPRRVSVGADGSRTPSARRGRAARARRRHRAQRLARDALARAARRGGDAGGRIAYGPVTLRTYPGCSTPGCSTVGRRSALALGPDEISRTSRTGAADVRARRHHRSASPGRLHRATAAIGASKRALDDAASRDRRRGHGVRPARPRRRGVPDRHQVATVLDDAGDSRSTSSATRTRATPARSPTA